MRYVYLVVEPAQGDGHGREKGVRGAFTSRQAAEDLAVRHSGWYVEEVPLDVELDRAV